MGRRMTKKETTGAAMVDGAGGAGLNLADLAAPAGEAGGEAGDAMGRDAAARRVARAVIVGNDMAAELHAVLCALAGDGGRGAYGETDWPMLAAAAKRLALGLADALYAAAGDAERLAEGEA